VKQESSSYLSVIDITSNVDLTTGRTNLHYFCMSSNVYLEESLALGPLSKCESTIADQLHVLEYLRNFN